MSDTTPEKPVEPNPVEPTPADPVAVEPVLVDPVSVDPTFVEPTSTSAVQAESAPDSSPAVMEPAVLVEPAEQSHAAESDVAHAVHDSQPVVAAPAAVPATEVTAESESTPVPVAPRQTVYVHAPTAPQKKGNRGIGSLIALLSAVVFAAFYAGVVLVVIPAFAPPRAVSYEFLNFVTSWLFFVPVLVFAAAFILLVLVLNRAGWWAYILGSLVVGLVVYLVSIGILLLGAGVIGLTPSQGLTAFLKALQSPEIIFAGLVAREVALWMGAAIAARGRKVKARNAEAIAAYDRDSARARADYERAVAANAS